MKRRLMQALFILLVGLPAPALGCSSPRPPEMPAEDVVTRTAARLTEMEGFHFIIDRSGAPAYLDPEETLSFRRAEGDYAAPDRSRATVRVIGPGLVTDVSVISISEIQWQTNVLTGLWEELPPNWGFNPAVLFDAELGLQAILRADMSDLQETSIEKLEDGPDSFLYAVTGIAAGERLYLMSGGLIGPAPVTVTLWVAPETFELHRVLVDEPETGGESSIWQVDFSSFNQLVEINPPPTG